MALLERDNKVHTCIWKEEHASLKDMVKKHVDFSAVVIRDAARAYLGLDQDYKGHEVVNHANDEYVRGEWHTNTVEGFFSILKRGIYGTYHQVSPKHLQRYCDEFAARYNTRDIKDHERFDLSLKNSEGRLKYNQLIGK